MAGFDQAPMRKRNRDTRDKAEGDEHEEKNRLDEIAPHEKNREYDRSRDRGQDHERDNDRYRRRDYDRDRNRHRDRDGDFDRKHDRGYDRDRNSHEKHKEHRSSESRHGESRWRKRDFKRDDRKDERSERSLIKQGKRFEPLTEQNYGKFCDEAVTSFLTGDLTDFRETTSRLENLKVGTVRSLLNQE